MASVIGVPSDLNNLELSILPTATTLASDDLMTVQEVSTGQLKKITKSNLESQLSTTPSVNVQLNQQVVQSTSLSTTISLPDRTTVDVPGLSVTITPNATNSKIVLECQLFGEFEAQDGGSYNSVALLKAVYGTGGSATTVYLMNTSGYPDQGDFLEDVNMPYQNQGIAPWAISFRGPDANPNTFHTPESCTFRFIDDLAISKVDTNDQIFNYASSQTNSNVPITYTAVIRSSQGSTMSFRLNRTYGNAPPSGVAEMMISSLSATDNVLTTTFLS